MGKHKKFLKSEKAKVKLKGTKLKEPQNVTKTDFKVRKIVITEQLRNVQELGSVERKTHNIKDCLTRIGHSATTEAVSNLKDIILHQPEDFQKHIESIIKTIANMSLSIEKNDRKECFKIMDIIFSRMNESHLSPFYPIFTKYLTCAMTHIKPAIQEDSLLMLDLLLKHAPKFVAAEKDKILSPYLDLVSKNRSNNSERTLSVQLGNRITTLKFRKSVLDRLILFLKCINSERNDTISDAKRENVVVIAQDSDFKSVEFVGNPFANYPTLFEVPMSSIEDASKKWTEFDQDGASQYIMDKYVHTIMPLMFEVWVEVIGIDKKASSSIITQESALILRAIMDIIVELFIMIESQQALKRQFLKKYQDNFDKHLLSNFPYYQTGATSTNKKVAADSGGDTCVYQNLSIAIMYFNFAVRNHQRFGVYREKVVKFAEEAIDGWRARDPEFNGLMKKLIRTVFSDETRKIFGSDCNGIFNVLVRKCNTDQSSYDPKMVLVCEIIENHGGAKNSMYDTLLVKMIEALANSSHVPAHMVKALSVVAKTGNQTIVDALEKKAVEILQNLRSNLKITGTLKDDADERKMDIINLFYWIKDKPILQNIREYLSKNESVVLYSKLSQIVEMNYARV